MFRIAIIGKPNVGKSTLFNKLAGRVLAIVGDISGITRDRKEATGYLGDMVFEMIDTAGWEDGITSEKLEYSMIEQVEAAIKGADLCLFITDARGGITNTDILLAEKLRKIKTPILLVANKCEAMEKNIFLDGDYYKLGFGKPISISAEHKDGFILLYEAIAPFYEKFMEETEELREISEEKPIQIAIVGKPNTGKSTLLNQLLGESRVITSDVAGTTRDSIAVDWEYAGKRVRLVDTAGLRKKRNIDKELERLSVEESLKSLRFGQVVIMMMDATDPFNFQDNSILSLLVQEGRGVVLVLNKWDLIRDKKKLLKEITESVKNIAPEINGCPIVPISAKTGENINKLMEAVFVVFDAWNVYISTSKLNNWLKIVEQEHAPPLFRGSVTKLKYITQIKRRPPTFALFTNSPERLEKTQYNRFIVNALRRDFKLENTVIRLILKKSDNPFEKKKGH
ncbi:MAG: ribosome biogenesis GTPase Der [Rickettsiales bacterium]|jgi:GTP-binding protein|nr:ribosome biogenesis GTPase Der [Rickettsiales bacterium]